jgi:hypothetical protein
MHPLPKRFFGESGIPCVFAVDDAGNTAIGWFIKQLGSYKFRATNGSVTKVVQLAQRADDVADLNHMPPGTCTILVEQFNGSPENIRHITETRCLTVQGNVFPWHPGEPTPRLAGILEPVLDISLGIALENGDFWMLEPLEGGRMGLDVNYRGYYLAEVTGYFELLQDGSLIDFEDDSGSLLLETAP